MQNKSLADTETNIETTNGISNNEKSLKSNPSIPHRVDINVLKSKLQENENKEFKKNLFILSSLLIVLGVLGIYLSI